MGGTQSHLNHVYDNPNLTFGKMKKILSLASQGKLNSVEKTDGAQISLSFKDGKGTYARNKSDLLDLGRDINDLINREFAGGDKVKNAYLTAFKAYESAIKQMPQEVVDRLFQDGTIFYNAEIQGPAFSNVINYDKNVISIHHTGHKKVDPETKEIHNANLSPETSKLLDKAIDSVEQKTTNSNFALARTAAVNLKGLSDDKDLKIVIAKIEKVMNEAGVSNGNTIEDYLRAKLTPYVQNELPEVSEDIQNLVVENILGNTKLVGNLPPKTPRELRQRISQIKKESKRILGKAIWPIEEAIHDFAVELLKGMESAYILDNREELKRLRSEVGKAIKIIKQSGNEDAIGILTKQLAKIKHHDNVNTTLEGFVFQFDGVTYKFTGNYAPVNQILGLFRYGRGKKIPKFAPKRDIDEQEFGNNDGRVIAAVPGGFKPPHAGHFGMAKFFADKPEVDVVYILISPKERSGHSVDKRISVNKDMSLKLWKLYAKAEPKIKPIIASHASPVKAVYDFMEKLSPGDTYLLGQGEKEIEAGDTRFNRAQDWSDKNDFEVTVKVVSIPPIAGGISGTKMRETIAAGNATSFMRYIPQHLSPQEKRAAWDIVSKQQDTFENLVENAVYETINNSDMKHHIVSRKKLNEQSNLIPYKPEDTLESFLARFEGMTYREAEKQATYINLYLGNKYGVGGDAPEQEKMVQRFTNSVISFLNRKWLAKFGQILNATRNPDDETKAEHGYDEYMQIKKQKSVPMRKMFQSRGDPELRAKYKKEMDDISQQLQTSEWAQFMKQVNTIHKKAVAERDHAEITSMELQLDGSPESERMKSAFEQVKNTVQEAITNNYQKDVAKGHKDEKTKLIGSGPQDTGSPFDNASEKDRSKSAPPIGENKIANNNPLDKNQMKLIASLASLSIFTELHKRAAAILDASLFTEPGDNLDKEQVNEIKREWLQINKRFPITIRIIQKYGLKSFLDWSDSLKDWVEMSSDRSAKVLLKYVQIYNEYTPMKRPKWIFRGLAGLDRVPEPEQPIYYSSKRQKATSWADDVNVAKNFCGTSGYNSTYGNNSWYGAGEDEDDFGSSVSLAMPGSYIGKYVQAFMWPMDNKALNELNESTEVDTYLMKEEKEWAIWVNQPVPIPGVHYCEGAIGPTAKARVKARHKTLEEKDGTNSGGFKRVPLPNETDVKPIVLSDEGGDMGPPKRSKKKKQKMKETSAASAGAVEGAPGMRKNKFDSLIREEGDYMIDRKQFMEELKLREKIREVVKFVYSERLAEGKREQLQERGKRLEENRIRSYVRQVLSEVEVEDDTPHHSTGINILENLLKKIIPILEEDYKALTTSDEQRKSFRAHIINAVQNTIAPDRSREQATHGQNKFIPISEEGDDDEDDGIDVRVGPQGDDKFIDIDDKPKKSEAEKEAEKENEFGIDGEDQTGRNMSLQSFEKIEQTILDSYNLLHDEEDLQLFYDYLLTNLKLYFDKFEDELQVSLQEPTTPEYEDEKEKQEDEFEAGATADMEAGLDDTSGDGLEDIEI